MSTDGYTFLLRSYVALTFRDFESYLRIGCFLDEDDLHLFWKQYISKLVTSEIPPGNYSIKGIAEVVYTKADRPGTLQLEYDDITKKTKFILKRFAESFEISRFIEKYFSNTLLGFTPSCMINIVLTSMVVPQMFTPVIKF